MDGNCALEFRTVTVALVGLVAAGIVATVVVVAVVATVVVAIVAITAVAVATVVDVSGGDGFDFEVSFNSRFSQIFVVFSFKFVSLAKLLLTSIVFNGFVLKIDIFCLHLTRFTLT